MGGLGGGLKGRYFFNFGWIDMIQKINVFKSKFWVQKKILGVYRIFYERRNFFENFEFVIFTQKSTFFEGLGNQYVAQLWLEWYILKKSAHFIIFWSKKNVVVFTNILVLQKFLR